MDACRHSFCEQPWGSDLYKLPVWVRLYYRAAWCRVQQCAAGLIGIGTGRPIRKDSEFWASDERVLAHVRKFVCTCTELHAAIGRDELAQCAQVWPVNLCNGIAKGCIDVLKDKHGKRLLHALILQDAPFLFWRWYYNSMNHPSGKYYTLFDCDKYTQDPSHNVHKKKLFSKTSSV